MNIPSVENIPVDNEAKQEEKVFPDYEKAKEIQDGEHGLRLRNVVFNIACISIKFLTIVLMVILTVWLWHLIAPSHLRWLTETEWHGLERILFASTVVSVAGQYFSKYQIIDKKR